MVKKNISLSELAEKSKLFAEYHQNTETKRGQKAEKDDGIPDEIVLGLFQEKLGKKIKQDRSEKW